MIIVGTFGREYVVHPETGEWHEVMHSRERREARVAYYKALRADAEATVIELKESGDW
jgi:hypothetical protein